MVKSSNFDHLGYFSRNPNIIG